jgi:translation initiation factor IF-2
MNDRVRIYELARKMNLPNEDLITACRELGYDIKSHSSTIDAQQVGLVIAHLNKRKKGEPSKTEAKNIVSPTTAKPASSTTKTTPAKAAAAAPAAPPQKPRVLARYRREPLPEAGAEPTQEQAPAAEGPQMSPAAAEQAAQQAAMAEAAAAAVVTTNGGKSTEEAAAEPAESEQQQAPPKPQRPASPPKEEHFTPSPTQISSRPTSPSRAVVEQQRLQQEIELANERSRKRAEEQAAQQALAEQKAREEAARKEAARHEGGAKKPQQPRNTDPKDGPQGNDQGKPDAGGGRPSGSQPIRVGAPSFRATPPRPPKSHRHNQPQERHATNLPKKEEKRAAAVVEIPKEIAISGPLTVKELAEKMAQPDTEIIKRLFMKGVMRTVNQLVEPEISRELATEMGYDLQSQEDMDIAAAIAAEEAAPKPVELTEADIAAQVTRAPIVTIMGHVDHGKTSLLDAIRQTKFLLTDSEHGGITQHIGAYHVEVPSAEDGTLRQIVFLDTPGHEAFTAMRARGAKVTDIAILVVAADDGIMPQTIEAIDHAKAAGVPIIVAINKVDKAGADPQRVLTEMMNYGLVPEEYGGPTVCVKVSAKKKTGLDELLEMILLVADVQDLKANPEKPATGSIVEAELSRGKGAVATALVANGTLREGDAIVAGSTWGRVRALFDDRGQRVKAAGPSMPVEVLGLKEVPQAGDRFEVVADESTARDLAELRKSNEVEVRRHHVTLESLHELVEAGEVKDLNIIVKADVQGTAEAIAEQLVKLSGKEVVVRILRTASGDISETDINLAASSNAIMIGFNVQPDNNARQAAETQGVDVRTYTIIYQIIDDLNLAIQGLLQPIRQEEEVGMAEVRALFKVGKNQMIAGCMVTSGKIPRGATVRIEREGKIVYDGKIETLKRFKDDAKEVAAGFECGMSFEKFTDLHEGDIIRAFIIKEIKRELTR